MAGTSTPFFLYRTGSPPFIVSGGVRSLFAFWMGGASSKVNGPPPPPPPPPPTLDTSGGGARRRQAESKREAAERARAEAHRRGISDIVHRKGEAPAEHLTLAAPQGAEVPIRTALERLQANVQERDAYVAEEAAIILLLLA